MYPTQFKCIHQLAAFAPHDDDDATIITSNCKTKYKKLECANAITIAPIHAIANTGATSIFIMKGTPVKNLRTTNNPITISLTDGSKVTSTHICDIYIPGLPTVLTGHIVPGITMASLIGIRILCKAGCKVVFDDEKCEVFYKNNIILKGHKDPTTDLWTLPIFDEEVAKTTPESDLVRPQRAHMMLSHHVKHAEAPIKHAMVSEQPSPWVRKSCDTKTIQLRPGPCLGPAQRNTIVKTVGFSYARTTKINNVKFAHQSFGNPPITSILKAINAGFLNGAPHLDAMTVRKYLVASPATAKGHMKRPRKGIRSTTPKETTHILRTPQRVPDVTMPGLVYLNENEEERVPILPLHNLINDIEDESIANVFCFGAFADKISGVVYNDCTRDFPYMSLDGNVCFFVMYHYETNGILITPIAGLDSERILEAYTKNFEYLVSKGFKPKVNVMDNQATKAIKAYLTPQQVTLQLVEPHNHRVNAAERAIQTFKNRFIGALGTTDSEFPIQLWDKLAPQVQDCINLLRRSRISPTKSAYETLEGPYDWNRYPLAPLGTRAIIYEDSDTRASWAPHGLDAWYLGPSKDHYRCHIYYVPETKGYRVSGSAELFPQHCREPTYSPDSHVNEVSAELQETMATVGQKSRTVNVLKLLAQHLEAYLPAHHHPRQSKG